MTSKIHSEIYWPLALAISHFFHITNYKYRRIVLPLKHFKKFEKSIATPQRFWPHCTLFQILRHILSHENSFVDCMTWRRKDVSLSPLRWQFFCLVLCIAQCNNENKKKTWKIAIFHSKTDKCSNVLKLFSLKQKTSTST